MRHANGKTLFTPLKGAHTMADSNRGRPRDDRDIYSSSNGQKRSRRPPHGSAGRTNSTGGNSRPPRSVQSAAGRQRSSRAGRAPVQEEEIDRYNYVNRDIYSSSRKSRKSGGGDGLPPKKKKRKAKKILIAILCIAAAVVIGVVTFVAVLLSRINHKPVDTSSYVEQPADAPAWDVISDNAITNILLLGVDRSEDGTAQRTDTMMLVSINSKTKNLNMVSFLRDLYVDIPTAGKNKINAAYTIGSQEEVTGAGLTMQTIENNFRINIDHYVEIDFENFIALIDAMGGIDLEMTREEVDYMSGWYYGEYGEPISLQVGMNHLDGKGALTFARIRKLDSDFGRTGRQRQVMIAIFDKFKTLNPAQMTAVFYDYAQYITTDLSSTEILSLAMQANTLLGYPVQTSYVPKPGLYTEINYNLVPDLPAVCADLRTFLYGDDSQNTQTVTQ